MAQSKDLCICFGLADDASFSLGSSFIMDNPCLTGTQIST
jgi:hypothetical protein